MGKDRACHRCGGFGHFIRECPTEEGCTADHRCNTCQGRGHFARDHDNMEVQPKGKGKSWGQGAENAGQWKGKGKGKWGNPNPEAKGKGKGGWYNEQNSWTKGFGKQAKGKRQGKAWAEHARRRPVPDHER